MQSLQDIGRISHGEAHRLEQRITAWADSQKAKGRQDGKAEAARKAKFVVAGIKSQPWSGGGEGPARARTALASRAGRSQRGLHGQYSGQTVVATHDPTKASAAAPTNVCLCSDR